MPRLASRRGAERQADRAESAKRGKDSVAHHTGQGPILQLQRMIGNRGVQRSLQSGAAAPFDPSVRPRVETEPRRAEEDFSSYAHDRPALESAGDIEPGISALRGGGWRLPDSTRERLEPHLADDLRDVRVHTGDRAAEMTKYLGARAFTVGRDVFFGRGEYQPDTRRGLHLLAHEATHTVQQSNGSPGIVGGSNAGPTPTIQKQEAPPDLLAEFERDRQRFARLQDEYFAEMGNDIRDHVMRTAGIDSGAQPANVTEALEVIQLWGLTINGIVQQLPVLGQSLSTRVQGTRQATSMQQQSQQLVAAMNQQGRQTYSAVLSRVRSEPFWRNHLDNNSIFIFPDLSGPNRYSGYTQRSNDRWNPAFIIHISKDALEAGQADSVAAALIHELSHTIFEGTIGRAMTPFVQRLAELLADHASVVALRAGAPNASDARDTHIGRIRQILYERTGYAEAEIFVHLQQFTHQPPAVVGANTIAPHIYILSIVRRYIERLTRIRLPRATLIGTLDMIARRVEHLYDRRIEALPANTPQRARMESFKLRAILMLRIARHEPSTDD